MRQIEEGKNGYENGDRPKATADDEMVVDDVTMIDDVDLLPPFLTPKYEQKRAEYTGGSVGISLVIVALVGLTHGVALYGVPGGLTFQSHPVICRVFLVLIYAQAFVAVLCLAAMFLMNPGFVERTPENCFPLPVEIEPWIRSCVRARDDAATDVPPPQRPAQYYLTSPENGADTYCVRCLVWRRQPRREGPRHRFFHCTTCQRCVRHFDHHCGVFGRCIAGKLPRCFAGCFGGLTDRVGADFLGSGNIFFFGTISTIGFTAYATATVSLVWSLSLRFSPQWVVPFFVVYFFLVQGILLPRLFSWRRSMMCQRRLR